MKHYYLIWRSLLLVVFVSVSSCIQRISSDLDDDTLRPHKEINTKGLHEIGDTLTLIPYLGNKIDNPYSLPVMQEASDILCDQKRIPRIVLEYTDLYVRFLPRDSTDYKLLTSMNLELFDYPLDYDTVPQEDFHDPSLPDSVMTWQYTTVPAGIMIPDIPHEVLDTCYIPEAEPLVTLQSHGLNALGASSSSFNNELELLAMQMVCPELLQTNISAGNIGEINAVRNSPTGYVTVQKDSSTYLPVKGVKVRVNNIVKHASAYTDDSGRFIIDKSFLTNVHYSLKFVNKQGFNIYGSGVSLTPSFCWYGVHSSSHYDMKVTQSQDSWVKAVVNNAVYDYYKACDADGRIHTPAQGLLVYAFPHYGGDSTPMLSRIGYQTFRDYSSAEIGSALLESLGIIGAVIIRNLVPFALPDVTVKKEATYDETYHITYHEMSHTSHFAASGTSLWVPLIVYSVLCWDDYGDGTDDNHMQNVLELAESWAFANERIIQKKLNLKTFARSNDWFSPSITAIFDLLDQKIVSEKEMLECMPANVASITELHQKLIASYPDRAMKITRAFVKNGAFPKQTTWYFKNNTGQTISFTIKKGNETLSFAVLNGKDHYFIGSPFIESNFYINSTHPEYYPDEITIFNYNGSKKLFHQKNGVTDISSLQQPFFYIHSWTETPEQTNAVKQTRKYTFTLTPSDL